MSEDYKELIERLDAHIPERMQAAGVPGLSIALVRQARILWGKAYGVKHAELRHPATRSTLFEAASLSKPLFAYGVLKLCARGALGLDTPLTDVLPPPPYVADDPRLSEINARRVLCHTTGLQNWLWQAGDVPAIHFTPGSRFSYSSLGYVYLQQAVERVTGETLHAFMQREVLDPLGMAHSSFTWREGDEVEAATGHDHDGKPVAKWKPAQALACASLHTTPLDYARFLIEMMAPRDEIAAQMLEPQVRVSDEIAWGLGWGLEQGDAASAFWHWGDNGVFKSFALASREAQYGVVIMTNSAYGLDLCEELARESLGGGHPAFAWLADFYR
jgi:CubicO group peptidase (beta-lactamase class C family)